MPLAKGRRTDAERAGEHCLVHHFGCVITRRMKRPAGGGQKPSADGSKVWNGWGGKVDIFACDVVGKRACGSHVYAQVTCGGTEAVRTRRRKLDAIPWHQSDTVCVMQMVQTPDPVHRSRAVFHFRMHYLVDQKWSVAPEAVLVPRSWFKAMKEEDLPDWKAAREQVKQLFS